MMSEDTSNNDSKQTAYERWELPHLENPTPTLDTAPSLLLRKDAIIIIEEIDEEFISL